MSNILITGGAGFISSHIVDALIQQSHQVTIIDNLSAGSISNLNPAADFIERDICERLDDIFRICGNKNSDIKFDYVFHLAAQINLRHSIKDPMADAQTNIMGSLNLFQCCVKYNVKRVIFSSTGGAIYSPDAVLPWDELSIVQPSSPYALSKLTIEKYLGLYEKLYGLKHTILRYSNVFGERQNANGLGEAGVTSIFIQKALKNEDIEINSNGQQSRDFIGVAATVSANLLAMDLQLDGIYNVSSDTQVSINDIAEKIIQMTGSKSKIIYKDAIVGELLHTQLNSDKLKKFGWQNDVSLDEGIKRTIEYFRNKEGK